MSVSVTGFLSTTFLANFFLSFLILNANEMFCQHYDARSSYFSLTICLSDFLRIRLHLFLDLLVKTLFINVPVDSFVGSMLRLFSLAYQLGG